MGTENWQVRIDADMMLSGRAGNVLANVGIETLGALASRTRAALLRIPNCGKKTIAEFESVLAGYGLKLGMAVNLNLPDLIEHLFYIYSGSPFNVNADPYRGMDWKQQYEVGRLWGDLHAYVVPTRMALAERKERSKTMRFKRRIRCFMT